VEALGVGAEPGTGIVREDLVELLAKSQAKRLERGLRARAWFEREHAKDLRGQVARLRAGPFELLGDSLES
jgi:hypothetical protein